MKAGISLAARIRGCINSGTGLLIALLISGEICAAFAVDGKHINGFAVSPSLRNGWRWPELSAAEGSMVQFVQWGKLCKFNIVDQKAVRCDTIFRGLASHPAISLNGNYIAFYRLGATVDYTKSPPKGQIVGSLNDSGWISVCDSNGQNLRNLVRVPATKLQNCQQIDMGPKVYWVAGDWVYYEKPPFTGEFWRVNVTSPQTTNQLICKTMRGSWCTESSYTCSNIGPWGIRRWSINRAGNRVCQQTFGCYPSENELSNFPYANGWYRDPASLIGKTGGCNGCISASGKYFAFFNGNHFQCGLGRINADNSITYHTFTPTGKSPSLADLAQWTGERRREYGHQMRWACNSDKWLLWMADHYPDNQWTALCGSDQVAMNWADWTGIVVSHNPYFDNCQISGSTPLDFNCVPDGLTYANDAGDLFVFGGPANSIEKDDGTWEVVPPVDPVAAFPSHDRISPAGFSAYIDKQGNLRVSGLDNGRYQVDVMDLSGRTVFSKAIINKAMTIPAQVSGKGLHIVRISGTAGSEVPSTCLKIAL